MPGCGKVCWEDARPGPQGRASRELMCLVRKEIALELQTSPEMDPPTLLGHRLPAPKMRRTQRPRTVTWLGCISAGVGAGPGAPRLAPYQGNSLSMMEYLGALYTGVKGNTLLPSWRFVGSFRKLMGKL